MMYSIITKFSLMLTLSFVLLAYQSEPIKADANKVSYQNEIQAEWRVLSRGLFQSAKNRLDPDEVLERLKKLEGFVGTKLDPEVVFLMDRLRNLINADEISWHKCSADDFQRRKREIASYLATSSNMVRYLLDRERRQFDKCKGTLAMDLLDALTNLSDQDKEKASSLAKSVFMPAEPLRRVGSSNSYPFEMNVLATSMVPGLLEYMTSTNGNMSPGILTSGETAKRDFEAKWSSSVGELCGKLMFEIEPKVRVFKSIFDDKLLESLDDLTKNWIKAIDVCRSIQAIGVHETIEKVYGFSTSS